MNTLNRTRALSVPVFVPGDFATTMFAMVKSILVLNLIDAVLTIYWVRNGLAYEMNPLLAESVQHFPIMFVLIKLSLVGLGVYVLWRNRSNRLAMGAIFVAFAAYFGLFLYHISYISYTLSPLVWL
jgi:hypothetical protein